MTDNHKYVLPEKACEILHQLGSDNDLVQFALGDLSAELVDEAAGVVLPGMVRRAIALEYGGEPSTIRDRERVARLVQPVLRDKYQVITFHQWRACCSVKDKSLIPSLADWALSQADQYGGRPASVRAIRRHLRENGAEVPGWQRAWERVIDMASELADDDSVPNIIRTHCFHFAEKGKHLSY